MDVGDPQRSLARPHRLRPPGGGAALARACRRRHSRHARLVMAAILITGFERFPGAPINPTAALVARLKRTRRPALADIRIATHVFATRYAAVDQELPALIAREKPDAILLFGVATKAKCLRIELLARNRALVLFPDAGGAKPS